MGLAPGRRPPLTRPSPPKIAEAVFDRHLDKASDAPIVVGFSGGGDSLALLLMAKAWADVARRPLLALTVDHRLQPQSADWTRQAEAVARGIGADFRALTWDGPKPATGLPAAARRARHALLAAAARETGAAVVLLGHTLDDMLEAEAMRRAGSSVGMPRRWSPSPVWPEGRGVFLLRPLLRVRRQALRDWLGPTGLAWIEDPANQDLSFARARARAALLDARPGEGQDDVVGVREAQALETLAEQTACDAFGVLTLARAALRDAEPGAGRRFLQAACLCASGGERPPRAERVERLRQSIAGPETFAATLAGARIEADAREVRFMRDAGETARGGLSPLPLRIDEPVVWDGRYEIAARGDGLKVVALKGLATRLPPVQRARLRQIPAAARGTLPVMVHGDAGPDCPVLAEHPAAGAKCLAGRRLRAACGLIRTERALTGRADGEPENGALS